MSQLLLSKKYSLIIGVIFILVGCNKVVVPTNTLISKSEDGKKNKITLTTYQSVNKGSRLTFAGGTLNVIDHCVYFNTGKENFSIIFPSTYKLVNNTITDGKKELKLGQDMKLNGHMIDINDQIITFLNISKTSCLTNVKRAWLYY